MIQDQALVASKHYLVETKDKNLADNLAGTEDKIEDIYLTHFFSTLLFTLLLKM